MDSTLSLRDTVALESEEPDRSRGRGLSPPGGRSALWALQFDLDGQLPFTGSPSCTAPRGRGDQSLRPCGLRAPSGASIRWLSGFTLRLWMVPVQEHSERICFANVPGVEKSAPGRTYDSLSKELAVQAEFDVAEQHWNYSFPSYTRYEEICYRSLLTGNFRKGNRQTFSRGGEGAPDASPPRTQSSGNILI